LRAEEAWCAVAELVAPAIDQRAMRPVAAPAGDRKRRVERERLIADDWRVAGIVRAAERNADHRAHGDAAWTDGAELARAQRRRPCDQRRDCQNAPADLRHRPLLHCDLAH